MIDADVRERCTADSCDGDGEDDQCVLSAEELT